MSGERVLFNCPSCGADIQDFNSTTKAALRGKTWTKGAYERDDLDSVVTVKPCGHTFEGEEADAVAEQVCLNEIHYMEQQLGQTRND